jgi:hypothetical protein
MRAGFPGRQRLAAGGTQGQPDDAVREDFLALHQNVELDVGGRDGVHTHRTPAATGS